jgi:hypothetical protein
MASYSSRVLASADDGYWAGGWSYNSSQVGIGKNFLGGDVYSAFRFNSVNIPQGTTITSATLTIVDGENNSKSISTRLYGIDEDDTADFSSDPGSRSKTTAYTDYSQTNQTTDNTNVITVTSIVQEIVNRGSWSSGNDMGFISADQGSSNDNILRYHAYDGSTTKCALLTINWSGASPSASPSLSPSSSQSPSSSPSPSSSISPSSSPSSSVSASPSPMPPFFGIRVAKENQDALSTDSPYNLKFDSRFGTLKYFDKQPINISFDANNDIAGKGTYTHNLGYYPFVEVFVRVYIGTPSGNYEYCPFHGAGATVFYHANYKITETDIIVYGEINGVSTSTWNFDFLVFIYKNDLGL